VFSRGANFQVPLTGLAKRHFYTPVDATVNLRAQSALSLAGPWAPQKAIFILFSALMFHWPSIYVLAPVEMGPSQAPNAWLVKHVFSAQDWWLVVLTRAMPGDEY
jgi:hypothetical protein